MDTLSHALWGKGLFGYRGSKYAPFILGAAPDLIAFFPFFIYKLINGLYFEAIERPRIETIPEWVFTLYDFSHSFLTGFTIILILYVLKRDTWCFAAFAWPFHTILDSLFHSKEFFATKIFFPLSSYSFDGISWATPQVWFTNVGLILVLFIYRKFPRH
ncbi:hypothetical protein HN450_03215 [bacterium]|nr:hypothetical protein [bacterium]MBT3850031.1 hypothetical protein [bacterium]MBT4434706.1 hypothetical protein [bacterium]MDG2445333.1 hypothetical protein [Thermodesulfobacteriota bacterium]